MTCDSKINLHKHLLERETMKVLSSLNIYLVSLELCCLTPHSTTSQLYRGGHLFQTQWDRCDQHNHTS